MQTDRWHVPASYWAVPASDWTVTTNDWLLTTSHWSSKTNHWSIPTCDWAVWMSDWSLATSNWYSVMSCSCRIISCKHPDPSGSPVKKWNTDHRRWAGQLGGGRAGSPLPAEYPNANGKDRRARSARPTHSNRGSGRESAHYSGGGRSLSRLMSVATQNGGGQDYRMVRMVFARTESCKSCSSCLNFCSPNAAGATGRNPLKTLQEGD